MFHFARRGSIEYVEIEEWSALNFMVHAFCTRHGGVSGDPFSSLNTGFVAGDGEENVRRNLALVGDAFAIPAERLVLMGQVHGSRICVIEGDEPPPAYIPECDGLITSRPRVALGIRTADCVPLLFVDLVRRVVGAAHAGWRGASLGIAGRMVNLFRERFSSRVEDIQVAVGPAIGPCCCQVDAPVLAAFSAMPQDDLLFRPCREKDRWMVDLALAARLQIQAAGVPGTSIRTADLCTVCRQELFFSHRAAGGGHTGRQINLIMLREGGEPKSA